MKDIRNIEDLASCQMNDESTRVAFTQGYLLGWNLCACLLHLMGREKASLAEAYYTALHFWNIQCDLDILDIDEDFFSERPFKGIQFKHGYIYILKADNGVYKIGQTTWLDARIKQLGIQLPYELELEHIIATDHVVNAEQVLHEHYEEKRQRGEWFALTIEDLEVLKSLDYLFAAAGAEVALWFSGLKRSSK